MEARRDKDPFNYGFDANQYISLAQLEELEKDIIKKREE